MSELLLCAVVEARLTPNQREAFIDTQLLGRTHRDVAIDLGCTHANIGHLVARARKKLAGTEIVRDLRDVA